MEDNAGGIKKQMAREIKSIPILTKEAAKRFVDKVDKANKQRATIDFSRQVKTANFILKKANIR